MPLIFALSNGLLCLVSTVLSFVELAKEMLEMPRVKFILSDKLNQNPIEEFFAKQRDTGGSHDNPSLEQFGHAMMRNIVAGSSAAASSKANVTLRETIPDSVSGEPLPKRKRLAKKF